MGQIYRKKWTERFPSSADISIEGGKPIARWRLRSGKVRTAELVEGKDGKLRARGQSRLYTARYKDGAGRMVEVSTNCRDRVAALAVLADLERKAELVRAGVMSAEESSVADHSSQPMSKHVDAYVRHLQTKGGNPRRIAMVRRRIERIAEECRITKLGKLTANIVEGWLFEQSEKGMSAVTRNTYRESIVGFGNWCRRTHRLTVNPFLDLPRADQHVDRRHERRALTADELARLLEVADKRPLAEYGRESIKKGASSKRRARSRATWEREPLSFESLDAACERAREALIGNPAFFKKLERTGRERRLLYLTLAMTGLRKGELASLTVGQIELAGPVAYAVLRPAHEKNRKGSNIPLRADLVAELNAWLADRLTELQNKARAEGKPIPVRLPSATPLFNVPSGLTRIFDRDLAVAGIPKRDERDRVIDVHALRVTFCSHLLAAGVPLRTAQVAMRHSKPELTARVYSDPQLLDVAGAINALPTFSGTTASKKADVGS